MVRLFLFSFFFFISGFLNAAVDRARCERVLDELLHQHRGVAKLFPGEQYMGGTQAAEMALFRQLFWETLAVQEEFAAKQSGIPYKTQHRKLVGTVLLTKAEVLPNIPEDLRVGVFGQPAGTAFEGAGEFTRGLGFVTPDGFPDVTGFANRMLIPGEGGIFMPWDHTFTHGVSGFARNPLDFAVFMRVQAAPWWKKPGAILHWAATQPKAAYRIASSVGAPRSVVLIDYESGHTYGVGKNLVKFGVEMDYQFNGEPGRLNPKAILDARSGVLNLPGHLFRRFSDRQYLGTDLEKWMEQGETYLVLYAKRIPNNVPEEQQQTLVEDGTAALDGDKIPLMRIRLMAPCYDGDVVPRIGFNPSNDLGGTYPAAGRMGRGRPFAYWSSQLGRGLNVEDSMHNGPELQALTRMILSQHDRLRTRR